MSITVSNNTGTGVSAPFPVDKTIIDTFNIGGGNSSFMRPKTITFTAQGLKPNTQYYAFFNDVYVGQYCSAKLDAAPTWEDNVIIEGDRPLVTNAIGMVVGNFYMPANTFVTGSHTFKLVDRTLPWPITDDQLKPDPVYGFAEARYESNSILKLQELHQTANVDAPFIPLQTHVVSGLVSPISAKIYEKYYFEYVVVVTTTERFAITTNSGTPPTNPAAAGGQVQGDPGTVTYISTTTIADNVYDHYYSHSRTNVSARFRQEQTVEKLETVDDTKAQLTSLTNFRPSGLDPDATVEIVTQWTAVTDRYGDTLQVPENNSSRLLNRTDPIAQSFTISPDDYPAGLFTTAIGVYFKTADQATPVILEIRDMANGLPGSNVLPGSTSVVPGYATMASADATIATIFRFSQPIYLGPNNTYCFVLRSSSSGYNIWASRVGELDVTLGIPIDSQPFEGVLFKSENNTTWVPESFEDIKFDLYKANFTEKTGVMYFDPRKDDVTNTYYSLNQTLPLNYISTEKDSSTVTIKIPMHGLTEGAEDSKDKIYIANVPAPLAVDGYNGYNETDFNGEHEVVEVLDKNLITIALLTNATETGPLYIGQGIRTFDATPRIMPTAPVFYEAPQYISADGGPSSVSTTRVNFTQPPVSPNPSANTFTVFTNVIADEFMLDYLSTKFSNTNIAESVTIAKSEYLGVETISTTRDDDFEVTEFSHLIALPANEDQHAGDLGNVPSFRAEITLTSNNKDISPIIDINGFSLVTRTFVVDNQEDENGDPEDVADLDPLVNSELNASGGNAAAKWKSPINILDGFFYSMNLFVTSNRSAGALYDVYIRTSSDIESHADLDWTYLGTGGYDNVTGPSDVLLETHFTHNVDEVEQIPFNTFDVKIVFRTTNSSDVSKIYSIRGIANYYIIPAEEV